MEILTLKKRKDFVRVAHKGLKMVTSTVILQATQSLSIEKDNTCVGYTATKKLGRAHVRNRTKRRLRAAVREAFPTHARTNTDYILIGRYNTASCDFKSLVKDMKWGLKKISSIWNAEGKEHEKPTDNPSDSPN